ncbi:hypothetical protein ACFPPA_19000 [Rhodanobacter ginsengisoli]|uniref:DUF4345 domain-containing protein n=1 Tax=Rhodanobacter ginsengisoli TaxID=418646 RepID=A0ABW0QSR0_9GAMM
MAVAKESRSIALSLVAAGFGPAVGGTLFSALRGEFGDIPTGLMISLAVYPVAFIFACIFGLPLFFLARRFKLVQWWFATASGLLVGCAAQFFMLNGTHHLENLILYALEGISSALLFFTVWRWRAHA